MCLSNETNTIDIKNRQCSLKNNNINSIHSNENSGWNSFGFEIGENSNNNSFKSFTNDINENDE